MKDHETVQPFGVLLFFPGPVAPSSGASLGDRIRFSVAFRDRVTIKEGTIVKITRRAYHVSYRITRSRSTRETGITRWTPKDNFRVLTILKRAADEAKGGDQ